MRLFLVAGESSGDQRAAKLVEALRRRDPSLVCEGAGGPAMQAAGVSLIANLVEHAALGITDVLKAYPVFRRIFQQSLRHVEQTRPDAVILVDAPGFNLRLAQPLKRRGLTVLYYVSPQFWAWGERRVRLIQRYVDRLFVLLPFEQAFYRQHGIDVEWVGHPLVDEARATKDRAHFLHDLGLDGQCPTVALLPGSRASEVQRHLPLMLEAAQRLRTHHPTTQFLLAQAPALDQTQFVRDPRYAELPLRTVTGSAYDCLAASDLALVASGTATLETALLNCPMVVVYQTAGLTWWIGRRVVQLPYISLVNVIAGQVVVPELIQAAATPDRLTQEAERLLQDAGLRDAQRREFAKIREALGPPGASDRAAAGVLRWLQQR
ncbi:MAG: lipid-A-disaccharide synthase [Candidatus Omnitrophica bacterium]|nr:lipid-A-disaccharide synthase [Candidatus Omnitrophota bacterium]